jgi:large-conductance mechanosensitive channel
MNLVWLAVAFVIGVSMGAIITMALVAASIRRQFRNHFWS